VGGKWTDFFCVEGINTTRFRQGCYLTNAVNYDIFAKRAGNIILVKDKRIKKQKAPFMDKIPLLSSLILSSIDKNIVEKIYLFGSYAYGKPNRKSDIDICVIIEDGIYWTDICMKIRKKLSENEILPCDLLVFNKKDFFSSDNPIGIENTIIEGGRILYEK